MLLLAIPRRSWPDPAHAPVIFADAAATTPVRREVLEAMWPYLAGGLDGEFGNASSAHDLGRRAADALERARSDVGRAFDARPAEVIFTSGGTESCNLAIKGLALANPRDRHLITTAIEHQAVLQSVAYLERFHGFTTSYVRLTPDGVVEPAELKRALAKAPGEPNAVALVSIHHANNEIGVVQPIAELATVARAAGALFHTDAVQSAASLPVSLRELGVDAVSLTGHKLGAPKGIGALLLRHGCAIEPLIHGGGQEGGLRSGTEPVALAVGFAAAVSSCATSPSSCATSPSSCATSPSSCATSPSSCATNPSSCAKSQDLTDSLITARDELIAGVLQAVPSAILTGPNPLQQGTSVEGVGAIGRLPGHASFLFPGISGEAMLIELEQRGIVASSGSACSAGSAAASHVLLALGYTPEVAETAVRFSFDAPFDTTAVVQTITDAHHLLAR